MYFIIFFVNQIVQFFVICPPLLQKNKSSTNQSFNFLYNSKAFSNEASLPEKPLRYISFSIDLDYCRFLVVPSKWYYIERDLIPKIELAHHHCIFTRTERIYTCVVFLYPTLVTHHTKVVLYATKQNINFSHLCHLSIYLSTLLLSISLKYFRHLGN